MCCLSVIFCLRCNDSDILLFVTANDRTVSGSNVTSLHIGDMEYRKYCSQYIDTVLPCDVQTALTLLTHLYLENHIIDKDDSMLYDSAMLFIKKTTAKESLTTIPLDM
jgi:hypothetical protein